jgi:hypothetical protein
MFSDFDAPSDGGHDFESASLQLLISHRLNSSWSVQASVPYLDRELDGESESGLGDASIIGVYNVYESRGEQRAVRVDIYGGLKMPTGDSDRLKEEQAVDEGGGEEHAHAQKSLARHAGEHHDEEEMAEPADDHAAEHHAAHSDGHHLALGSGSWDPIAGAIVRVDQEAWRFSADIQYVLRTEGDYDFEYGDGLFARAAALHNVADSEEMSVHLGVAVSAEWSDDNEVDGVTQDGSGKEAGYVGPIIQVNMGESVALSASLDLPVYNEDDGLSGAADYRVRAGFAGMF